MPGIAPNSRWLAAAALCASASRAWAGAGEPVEFGREVRPILSAKCFACHGPDAEKRKASLRLDRREDALRPSKAGLVAIAPGRADASELVARVTSSDEDERMPPASSGKTLDASEIEVLRRWIDAGAEYAPHWAFVPPARPAPPATKHGARARNAIDAFVFARLEARGLAPAPEAEREALARRASLDLTGIPPTLAEVDAFLADRREDAYERLVDRLLASPGYAENQARFWLDEARYGDTHGYHLDNERQIWRWREWVIDAYERNVPFDTFAIEQIAGDLLPNASLAQKIATGFNRCNPTTGEGGLIPEEYLAKYAMDRVDTTTSVFLGLTMGCCQCHDHKFDPLTQREYYQLYAYFGSLAEKGSDENAIAPPPSIQAPDEGQARQLAELTRVRDSAQAALDGPLPEIDAAEPGWEARAEREVRERFTTIVPTSATSSAGSTLSVLADGSVLATGTNPERDVYELGFEGEFAGANVIALDALPDPSLPLGGAGRAYNANFVLTGFEVEATSDAADWHHVRVARALADHAQDGFPAANAIDADPVSGWAVSFRPERRLAWFVLDAPLHADIRHLRVRLRHESKYAQHAIGRLRLSVARDPRLAPSTLGAWRRAGPFRARTGKEAFERAFVDETRVDFAAADASGAPIWTARPDDVDGRAHAFQGDYSAVYLAREITSPEPRRVRIALGSDDALRVWSNGALVHSREDARALKVGEDALILDLVSGVNVLVCKVVNYTGDFAFSFTFVDEEIGGAPLSVVAALARDDVARTDAERKLLRDHYREFHSPEWRARREDALAAEKTRAGFEAAIPRTMISQDLPEPRPTHVLTRGQYDKLGERVEPGVPAVLPPLPPDAPRNRLALARWIADAGNPLTARVAVNRIWAQHFGTGIVATTRDFGAQGEWPSHRELLDWLAVEFVASGWDVRHLHRLVVTSAAYRQSTRVTGESARVDPDARLLSRAPRPRLDAEVIRDAALSVSGLLVMKVGGPSVRPYQPEGLWEVVAYPTSNTAKFVADRGESLWRRSLYTFWKRTSPPPSMTTFDAPSREVSTCERPRTNTPLQALCALNDVQFVECARALAQRLVLEGGSTPESRVAFGFRLVTARTPRPGEVSVLVDLWRTSRASFAARPADAVALLSVGESPRAAGVDPVEHAAWTIVAQVLLNLDETLTRS